MARDLKQGSRPPELQCRACRVNFRNGTLKSPFYLNAVDLDIQPPQGAAAMEWSYEASPARTDRAEQGFGRFSGRGQWTPAAGRLQVDLELERTVVSELLILATGRDLGLQGRFTSRATLDGPVENLKIRGSLELEDVERSSYFGLRGSRWALDYEGSLDLARQELKIQTVKPKQKAPLPLAIEVGCERILAAPAWTGRVTFEELPAEVLVDLGHRLGLSVPEGLKVAGKVVGSLLVGSEKPSEGQVELRQAQVSLGAAGPLAVEVAHISLGEGGVQLGPAPVRTPGGSEMEISGKWRQDASVELQLETKKALVEELKAALEGLKSVPAVPLVSACATGWVSGVLRLEGGDGEKEAAWQGDVQVGDLHCASETLAGGWRLDTGRLQLRGPNWKLAKAAGLWGPWKFGLEANWQNGSKRPVRLALDLDSVTGAQIDDFFRPALAARRGFLDRTLRRPQLLPEWLKGRHAEGELRIRTLKLGDQEFSSVASRFFWDGASVELPSLSAAWDDATFSGRASVRLGGERYEYRALGRLDGIGFQKGRLEADLDVSASTLAGPLDKVLKGAAQLSGRDLEAGDDSVQALHACLDYDGARSPRLRLTCAEARLDDEWLTGTGASAPDLRWSAALAGARRAARASGTVLPLSLEIVSK